VSIIDDKIFPSLGELINSQIRIWPAHARNLEKRFLNTEEETLGLLEECSTIMLEMISGRISQYCEDYKWMCRELVREEIYFRKNGRYRNDNQQEVINTVYSDQGYMRRYLNGLFLSQLWWSNHSNSLKFYLEDFLSCFRQGSNHLEIGPGHGLLLYLASIYSGVRCLNAWDISQTALEFTDSMLGNLGKELIIGYQQVDITQVDLVDKGFYDSIVLSEILEHVVAPLTVLKNVYSLLSSKGLVFVNMPANSPAPDHLFLVTELQEVVDMVESVGFVVKKTREFPITGRTLTEAQTYRLTTSCCVIAEKL
jgi:2-polyprenyl-3-methyl-5-hydroxy-6-metoxy-1,4-benzoquinol methylase